LDAVPAELASNSNVDIPPTITQKRAAQMFAEMLGMVCHKEYLEYGNQTVTARPNHTNGQAFVVHLTCLKACFYWAEFTSDYLRAIRFSSLIDLKNFGTVKLCHTRALSLVDPDERVQFLEQFISVLRCITA